MEFILNGVEIVSGERSVELSVGAENNIGRVVQVPRTSYIYDSEGKLRAVILDTDAPVFRANEVKILKGVENDLGIC